VIERERDVRGRQRVVGDDRRDPSELRAGARQRLPPCRTGREQVLDGDRGAAGAAGVGDGRLRVGRRGVSTGFGRPVGADSRADRSAVARDEFESGGVGDRGQRLSPEAERVDADRVAVGSQLARGVALDRETDVFATHPRAVVGDPDPIGAVAVDRDIDA